MYKLVLGLDAAAFVCAKQILERTEHNNRFRLVSSQKFLVYVQVVVTSVFVRYILPTLKVDMRDQIFSPSRFYCRLESKDQYARQSHLLRQLITCESLSETHLRIPKKFRYSIWLFFQGIIKICSRLLNSLILLRTHSEILCPVLFVCDAVTQRQYSSQDIIHRTTEPLISLVQRIKTLETFTFKNTMYVLICETRTVITHCRFYQYNLIFDFACMQLLVNTLFCSAVCEPHFKITFVRLHSRQSVCVYCRSD